eukprot:6463480-Amphidinium_carterae.1
MCHRWVPSELNPTDAPSRKYEPRHVQKAPCKFSPTHAYDSTRDGVGVPGDSQQLQAQRATFHDMA